jgi:hypothetical protein
VIWVLAHQRSVTSISSGFHFLYSLQLEITVSDLVQILYKVNTKSSTVISDQREYFKKNPRGFLASFLLILLAYFVSFSFSYFAVRLFQYFET